MREVPESVDAVWEAALHVLNQSTVVFVDVNRTQQILSWLFMVPMDKALDLIAYGRLEARETPFGSELFVDIKSTQDDTMNFQEAEDNLARKINAQLRAIDILEWLRPDPRE